MRGKGIGYGSEDGASGTAAMSFWCSWLRKELGGGDCCVLALLFVYVQVVK